MLAVRTACSLVVWPFAQKSCTVSLKYFRCVLADFKVNVTEVRVF